MRKLVFLFAVLGLAVMSAKSFKILLATPAQVGATELKPGEYKVEVVDQKAIIRNGDVRVESPVKIETVTAQNPSTIVLYGVDGDKRHIREVHVGGTRTKLLFQ